MDPFRLCYLDVIYISSLIGVHNYGRNTESTFCLRPEHQFHRRVYPGKGERNVIRYKINTKRDEDRTFVPVTTPGFSSVLFFGPGT